MNNLVITELRDGNGDIVWRAELDGIAAVEYNQDEAVKRVLYNLDPKPFITTELGGAKQLPGNDRWSYGQRQN